MIDRSIVIQRARGKYGHLTNNITEQVKMYLENDATEEEQIPLFIVRSDLSKLRTILKTNRPRCEECNEELQMAENYVDFSGKRYPTAWICKCGRIEYSDNTAADWVEILR